MVKLRRLAELNRRLSVSLVEAPGLAAAFEQALRTHDEQALGDAFERLHTGPEEVRREVESAIIEWLFGAGGEVDAANMMPEPPHDCLN
jgi:hypothetical protein